MLQKRAIIMAKTIVYNDAAQYLVLRRSATDPRWAFVWDLPGGTVEYGEEPLDAALREAKEEAGLDLKEMRLIDVCAISEGDYAITITYAAPSSGTVQLSYEHDQYKWVTGAEFMQLNIPQKYKNALAVLSDYEH